MRNKFWMVIFLVNSTWAQNLLDNGGFESNGSFPTNVMQSDLCTGWSKCNQGGGGSPDYFHINGSGLVQLPNSFYATISPHGGSAIMGLITYHGLSTNFREYLSHALNSPLVVGATYNVQFYLSNGMYNGNYGGCGSNHFGMAFSTNQCQQIGTSPMDFMIPQYSDNAIFYHSDWQQVNFSFIADSAFQYLTIGNFTSNANTLIQNVENSPTEIAYFFVDDIQVVRADETTGQDVMDQTKRNVYYQSQLKKLVYIGVEGKENELMLINAVGNLIVQKNIIGSGEIDLVSLPSGLYFYRLSSENGPLKTGRFIHP